MKNWPKIMKFHLVEAMLFCHKRLVPDICNLLSVDGFALVSRPLRSDAPRSYCSLCPTI